MCNGLVVASSKCLSVIAATTAVEYQGFIRRIQA